jgi:hypothetical protein
MEGLELKPGYRCASGKQTLPAFRAVSGTCFTVCHLTIFKSHSKRSFIWQAECDVYSVTDLYLGFACTYTFCLVKKTCKLMIIFSKSFLPFLILKEFCEFSLPFLLAALNMIPSQRVFGLYGAPHS